MNIRLATLDDLDLLARLNTDVQRLHANALPHLFKQPDNPAAIIADFRERIFANVEGRVFFAELDDEAAGYVYAHMTHRPDNAYTYALDAIHIDQISVRPVYQGMGVGYGLVQEVFDWARTEKIKRVTLDTGAFNVEAQAFFKKQGFEVSTYRMGVTLQG